MERLRWWPLATACCWVLIEYAYSRIPFGGFGWTRIAYAAVDTPLAGFFPIIGVAGVSFVVALIGQLIAWGVLALRQSSPDGRQATRPGAGCRRSVIVLVLLGSALRLYQVEPAATAAGSVRVGIVQGNIPGRGIEAMGRARSVTNNHLSETIDLMTKARLGQAAGAGFPALAGELHRHRPDSRSAHQADGASRCRGRRSPDSGWRCDAGARC